MGYDSDSESLSMDEEPRPKPPSEGEVVPDSDEEGPADVKTKSKAPPEQVVLTDTRIPKGTQVTWKSNIAGDKGRLVTGVTLAAITAVKRTANGSITERSIKSKGASVVCEEHVCPVAEVDSNNRPVRGADGPTYHPMLIQTPHSSPGDVQCVLAPGTLKELVNHQKKADKAAGRPYKERTFTFEGKELPVIPPGALVTAPRGEGKAKAPKTSQENGAPKTSQENGAPKTSQENGAPKTSQENGAPKESDKTVKVVKHKAVFSPSDLTPKNKIQQSFINSTGHIVDKPHTVPKTKEPRKEDAPQKKKEVTHADDGVSHKESKKDETVKRKEPTDGRHDDSSFKRIRTELLQDKGFFDMLRQKLNDDPSSNKVLGEIVESYHTFKKAVVTFEDNMHSVLTRYL